MPFTETQKLKAVIRAARALAVGVIASKTSIGAEKPVATAIDRVLVACAEADGFVLAGWKSETQRAIVSELLAESAAREADRKIR